MSDILSEKGYLIIKDNFLQFSIKYICCGYSLVSVWHILSWRIGHEKISMAILPFPLFQEEQLSVTGERMCTKYW